MHFIWVCYWIELNIFVWKSLVKSTKLMTTLPMNNRCRFCRKIFNARKMLQDYTRIGSQWGGKQIPGFSLGLNSVLWKLTQPDLRLLKKWGQQDLWYYNDWRASIRPQTRKTFHDKMHRQLLKLCFCEKLWPTLAQICLGTKHARDEKISPTERWGSKGSEWT